MHACGKIDGSFSGVRAVLPATSLVFFRLEPFVFRIFNMNGMLALRMLSKGMLGL